MTKTSIEMRRYMLESHQETKEYENFLQEMLKIQQERAARLDRITKRALI